MDYVPLVLLVTCLTVVGVAIYAAVTGDPDPCQSDDAVCVRTCTTMLVGKTVQRVCSWHPYTGNATEGRPTP